MADFFKLGVTEDDFRDLISDSSKIYRDYKGLNTRVVENTYEMFLSNGERINLSFDEKNLPHLLGFKNLSKLSDGARTSIQVFKDLISNGDYREKIIQQINSRGWEYSGYMSSQYYLKTQYFKEIIAEPIPKNIYFVCKYNADANYGASESRNYGQCEYYIGKKIKNGDVVVIGLVKNKNTYVPRTNRVFKGSVKDEELEILLKNQKICFINNVRIFLPYSDSPIYTHYLDSSDKLDNLQTLKTLANKTGATFDCAANYLYDYKKNEEDNMSKIDLRELIEEIASSTSEGKITEKTENELEKYGGFKEVITHLINSINDKLCSKKQNDSANTSYTQLRSDFTKLTKQVSILQSKYEKSESRIKELEKQIRELKNEKEQLMIDKAKLEKKNAKLELKLTEEKKEDE